jgi:hypothetical protein
VVKPTNRTIFIALGVIFILSSVITSLFLSGLIKSILFRPNGVFLFGSTSLSYIYIALSQILLGISFILIGLSFLPKVIRRGSATVLILGALITAFIGFNDYYYASRDGVYVNKTTDWKGTWIPWSDVEHMDIVYNVKDHSPLPHSIVFYTKAKRKYDIPMDGYVYNSRKTIRYHVKQAGGTVSDKVIHPTTTNNGKK